MADQKEFKPLMLAIDDVLKALGTSGSLEPPLRQKVDRLQEAYVEYRECCCFFAHIVPFDPSSGRRPTPKPPTKAKKTVKKAKAAKKGAKNRR